MTENILEKLFEHNHWANLEILDACLSLRDEQLDAQPVKATKGSIRETLRHLVASQQGYLSYLSGQDYRSYWDAAPGLNELRQAAIISGEKLIELARGYCAEPPDQRIQTRDGFYTRPWVLAVQVINHATEHREQVKSMLSALGIAPPDIDSWTYAEVTGALVPMPK